MSKTILAILREEKAALISGGLYHQTQVKLAYNSNRIEGSKLSEEQTQYIYETNTIHVGEREAANVDDIIETVNHFTCFDYMLACADEDLSEAMIKEYHRLLKRNTTQERTEWFRVGDYKQKPNMVGGMKTTAPAKVEAEIRTLLAAYVRKTEIGMNDITEFHYQFEKIHPFQDGNGRVGRMILFKECLKNDIMPFIIDDEHKLFYYRGLREYETEKGYLTDTFLSAQDEYEKIVNYTQNLIRY